MLSKELTADVAKYNTRTNQKQRVWPEHHLLLLLPSTSDGLHIGLDEANDCSADVALRFSEVSPFACLLAAVRPAAAAAVAAAAAARAATERAKATVEAAHEAICARPRVRTLNTANHDGWQRGERLDGRDAVQVAVQQRVAGADNERRRS